MTDLEMTTSCANQKIRCKHVLIMWKGAKPYAVSLLGLKCPIRYQLRAREQPHPTAPVGVLKGKGADRVGRLRLRLAELRRGG